jgi:hypothetical protein
LPVIANFVLSLLILVSLIMEAARPSETSFLTKAAQHYIPEDDIPHLSLSLRNAGFPSNPHG